MTAKVAVKEFGRYLQSCRRSRGISLAVVSHQTKITLGILRQIENENLKNLPAPVFVKGFLKAFAFAVGADPKEAVHRFENYLACHGQIFAMQTRSPKRNAGRYRLALAMALFVAQIGATLYMAQWMQSPSSSPPQPKVALATVQPAPVVTLAQEKSTHLETPLPQETAPPQEIASPQKTAPPMGNSPESPVAVTANLKLRMTAVEATWLKVASDDNAPREFLLQMDQDVTMVARNGFDLVIGNASGIRLMLNEKPVAVTGKKGQVVDIHLP